MAVFTGEPLLAAMLESTGGHVRSLCIAMRELLDQVDAVPVGADVVDRVLRRLRRDMHRGLAHEDHEVLKEVAADGRDCDHPGFFRLLCNGYLLAYQDDEHDWYRPHPWLGPMDQP